jgi:transcriptional regulator with XRE-family HTH domain
MGKREPEIDADLGQRVMRAYLDAGLNRNQFAKKLETNYHNVIRWEKGQVPGIDYLTKIADITGVSLDWLVRGVEKPTTLEEDEGARAAVTELLAQWDPRVYGSPPDADEQRWIAQIDFRSDRRAGLEVTPSLIRDRLMERRAQAKGKAIERPKIKVPARPGTIRVEEAPRKRRRSHDG